MGIGAFITIKAHPAVAEERQLFLSDMFTGEHPRQDKVKSGGSVIQPARRHANQRDTPYVCHKKHRSGEHRGSIV